MNNFANYTYFILFLVCISINLSMQQRSKRFLTFPRTSPTRMQIISGIGIPVDLELESVTIGYVFKAEYFLPENASNYLSFFNDPFDLTTRPISGFFDRKKRTIELPKPTELPTNSFEVGNTSGYDSEQNEKYEKHEVEAEIVESGTEPHESDDNEMSEADYWNQEDRAEWLNDPSRPRGPQNLATSRWTVYKGFAALAENKGLAGKPCVLRAICESAHASFDHQNGILGELMHIIMTPSLTEDEITDNSDYEYLHAEKHGSEGAPCDRLFHECKTSILDQFTGVYTPMMDLINRIVS